MITITGFVTLHTDKIVQFANDTEKELSGYTHRYDNYKVNLTGYKINQVVRSNESQALFDAIIYSGHLEEEVDYFLHEPEGFVNGVKQ